MIFRRSISDLWDASLAAILLQSEQHEQPARVRSDIVVIETPKQRESNGGEGGDESRAADHPPNSSYAAVRACRGIGYTSICSLSDEMMTTRQKSTPPSSQLEEESKRRPSSISEAHAAMLPDDLRYEIYQSALGLVLRDGPRGRVHRELLQGDSFLTVVNDDEWDGGDYLGAMRIPALVS